MTDPFRPSSRLDAAALAGYAQRYGASVLDMDRDLARGSAPGDLIDLTHGDTRAFPPPPAAHGDVDAAIRANDEAYTPYRGSAAVRAGLADRVGVLLGRSVDPRRELIVTPGTQGGLFAALSSIVSPGDAVALPDPEYFMSERIVRYLGGDVARIAVTQTRASGVLSVDEQSLAAVRSRRPRALVLSHPNNPTGGVYSPRSLELLSALVKGEEMVAVIDELYCRLTYPPAALVHLGALEGMAERTVTLLGPSKTESMSGYRVAVAVAPPAAIDAMERVQSLASLRTAGYGQHALQHWMDGDGAWLAERVAQHQRLRDAVVGHLRSMPGVQVAVPAGSSYVFPQVAGWRGATGDGEVDDHVLALAFKEAGVLINPGYQFGPAGRSRFRVNFSQDERVLDRAFERMAEVLGSPPTHVGSDATGAAPGGTGVHAVEDARR